MFSAPNLHLSALLLPLYLIELYVLSVGIALFLCALYPKFRDIHHIWEILVQLGFWATPIIYPVSIVHQKYHMFIFLNPMARIIQGARQAIIGPPGNFVGFTNHIIIISVATVCFLAGLTLFNKFSPSFAEDL
jgi:ABC-2 type transport system permease protein